MAYSQKATQLPMARGSLSDGVWFGYDAPLVPFGRVVPAQGPADVKIASAHLSRAIERYREVLAFSPNHLGARLGLGWCLDQLRDRPGAIDAYRGVIELAVRQDEFVTIEAAGYLLPLLDPTRDRAEIARLQARVEELSKRPRPITPLVVPLDDDVRPVHLVDRAARVTFDVDGSALSSSWTWITPRVAWLVHAPDTRRPITSGLQLFGSVTFWMFWENGYRALEALDDNQDGSLTGSELRGLALWHDRDSDGVSDKGEVADLAHWQIVALSTEHVVTASDPDLAAHSKTGVTFGDGHVRPTFDVILHTQASPSTPRMTH